MDDFAILIIALIAYSKYSKMAILGTLLKKGIKLRESLEQEFASPYDLQKNELRKLLITARSTAFGQYYSFNKALRSFRSPKQHQFYDRFCQQVPIVGYQEIYEKWWSRARRGERDVCWPGKVNYFALSSGTAGSSSKHVPVTKDMLKSIRRTGVRHILTLSRYELPDEFFETGMLMLGGSTDLNNRGHYFEGDLSGITTSKTPFWFQRFYKPGQKIARRDWGTKLDEITRKAYKWDIGVVVGVPAWIQILLEKVISYYKVDSIHDVWPNLTFFAHGGVSFDPYRKGFEKLLGKPIYYTETYLASEGFVAYQTHPYHHDMKMVLNNGIFYEFIPFNSTNFDDEGILRENPEVYMIDQVQEDQEYALLLSTNAGTWRYLIGDVIKFVSMIESQIIITGRTRHFLSLCGEHMSLDNMNKAIELASVDLGIQIKEFAACGVPFDTLFAHQWYIGTDDPVNPEELRLALDHYLKELNDDYRVERSAALKEIIVDIIPTLKFYQWMRKLGKEGGQNKFPRVLNKEQHREWRTFINLAETQYN